MAKKITFFLWGALETACWFLAVMYPSAIPLGAIAISVGIVSTIILIAYGVFSIVLHWDDDKK